MMCKKKRLTYGLLYYKKMNHNATFSLICYMMKYFMTICTFGCKRIG